MPLTIGLTGGIASGKTLVSNYLSELGVFVIDTDIIARQVVTPDSKTTQQIVRLMGKECLLPDGNLDRKKIKSLIFNNEQLKSEYESIILPAIRSQTLIQINQPPTSSPYTLCVVPLLFEKNFDQFIDYSICVDIPEATQIERAIQRKPSDEHVIKRIIASQMSRSQRIEKADYILDNSQDIAVLYRQVDKLHAQLCKLAENIGLKSL